MVRLTDGLRACALLLCLLGAEADALEALPKPRDGYRQVEDGQAAGARGEGEAANEVAMLCTRATMEPQALYDLAWSLINDGRLPLATAVLQRAAALGHGGAAALLPRLPPPEEPACAETESRASGVHIPVLPPARIRELSNRAASRNGLDPELVLAVIAVESGFDQRAVSPKMAAGLMQLMPGTARRFGVGDVFDPEQNVAGGTRYLAWLLETFDGDLALALAGYNAGEGAVRRYQGVPPYAETVRYVEAVTGRYRYLQQARSD